MHQFCLFFYDPCFFSEDTVYALTPSGHMYRRLGVTETNYIGDAWERVPGSLAKISGQYCTSLSLTF